jgi:succinate dehydrogenase / fumarate reductase cytochrome b subunit
MAIKFSNTFLLRKLHQLTGIVPLGIFFFVHMYTNSAAMNGAKSFNKHVQDIHDMPYLIFIETFGIFIPLLFHSIYGILISAEARPNAIGYGYARNWFYIFQRVTGVFLFVFLLFHLLNLRFGLIPGLASYGNPVAGNAGRAFDIVGR